MASGDNTFVGATRVNFGQDQEFHTNAKINTKNDVDLFVFHLDAGETLTAVTDNGDDGKPDTILTLFDSAGAKITEDDDSNNNLESRLVFTADTSGDYYIGVSSFSNFATGDINSNPVAPEYEGDGGSTGRYGLDLLIA